MIQKAEDDKCLLAALWIYLNPVNQEDVDKAAIFDFLLLLIFNISRLSENEMCEILAKHLLEYYASAYGLEFQFKNDYTETQVINHYFTDMVKTWPMKKMIQSFKKDHVRRFG